MPVLDLKKVNFSASLNEEQISKINAIFAANPDKFSSFSHFIRVCIVKELENYDAEGNEKR